MNTRNTLISLAITSLIGTPAVADLPLSVNLQLATGEFPRPPSEVLVMLYATADAVLPVDTRQLSRNDFQSPEGQDSWMDKPLQTIRATLEFNLDTADSTTYWVEYQVDGKPVGERFRLVDPADIAMTGEGYIQSTSLGFLFPDGSIQGTAAQNTPGVWTPSGSNIYYDQGYVGIGATNPVVGLDIEGAAGYGSAVALNNTGGGLEWRLTSWTDGTFRLVKSSGTTFSPIVVEPVDGMVGIGTSDPDQQLSVHTSSGISYIRVSDNTSGPASGLRMGLSGSGNAYIINDEPTKSLSLGTDGTSQVRINTDGEVGINELNPEQTVHIKQMVSNKGLRIEHQSTADYWENGIGTTTKNYKFYHNNLFRADISSVDGSYTQSSDARLKHNIQSMGPVLSKVAELRPATYQYIGSAPAANPSMGFTAQEVERVFPSLVRNLDDGYKGVVYDGFAVISIRAIQELNEKVTALQNEIDDLKRAAAN